MEKNYAIIDFVNGETEQVILFVMFNGNMNRIDIAPDHHWQEYWDTVKGKDGELMDVGTHYEDGMDKVHITLYPILDDGKMDTINFTRIKSYQVGEILDN